MYAQPNKKNVTYIDDLPDLEDLESRGGMHGPPHGMQGVGEHSQFQHNGPPGGIPAKFQKFIRNPGGMTPPPRESGMGSPQQQHEFFAPPPPPQQQQQEQYTPLSDSPNCLDVHSHVQACPICSRFFKNDNTVYIIAIVILAIICILLLKRVLNL